ncbi:MAG: cell wall hydrolase [Mobilitalea sp.]
MSLIYSFLQKRRMQESHHGMVMVVIAYLLSILLLILGSDVFYKINSAAAGVDEETIVAQDTELQTLSSLPGTYRFTASLEGQMINPYQLPLNLEDFDITEQVTDTSVEDTLWFLGSAVDNETFEQMLGQLGDHVSNLLATAEKAQQNKIQSFSVKVDSSDSVVTVSEEEVTMLERIVEAEAGGEDMVGKILIANVIFNRMADDHFPDTVQEVIFQNKDGDYQFSPVKSKRYFKVTVSKETRKAVQRALNGEDYSEGALYFIAKKRASAGGSAWFNANLTRLFQHGGHEFYKNK